MQRFTGLIRGQRIRSQSGTIVRQTGPCSPREERNHPRARDDSSPDSLTVDSQTIERNVSGCGAQWADAHLDSGIQSPVSGAPVTGETTENNVPTMRDGGAVADFGFHRSGRKIRF